MVQKAELRASRPKGFSNSLQCLVPPAESSARWRSENPSGQARNTLCQRRREPTGARVVPDRWAARRLHLKAETHGPWWSPEADGDARHTIAGRGPPMRAPLPGTKGGDDVSRRRDFRRRPFFVGANGTVAGKRAPSFCMP